MQNQLGNARAQANVQGTNHDTEFVL